MASELFMIGRRPADWPIRTWSSLLILGGLLGFGSVGAQSPAAESAHGMRAAAATAPVCVTNAASLASAECWVTDSEEIVDPVEAGHGQAGAQSVVAPEPFVSFGSRHTVPIPTPSIDSVAARAPPST